MAPYKGLVYRFLLSSGQKRKRIGCGISSSGGDGVPPRDTDTQLIMATSFSVGGSGRGEKGKLVTKLLGK